MGAWSHNMNVDPETRPTWTLVAVMALGLVVEVFGEVVLDAMRNRATIDYAGCVTFCEGDVSAVGTEGCTCRPGPVR